MHKCCIDSVACTYLYTLYVHNNDVEHLPFDGGGTIFNSSCALCGMLSLCDTS